MSDVIFVEQQHLLVASDTQPQVVETVREVMVVAVADQGPPGPPGEPGPSGGDVLTITAPVAIGGHRVIAAVGDEIHYADPDDIATAQVIGLTVNAAGPGDELEVVLRGSVTNSSWSWAPGLPLYLGANGVLTQSPPSPAAAWVRVLGTALSATRILFNPLSPIATSA